MANKILLVWEAVPESVDLYVLDEGSEIAELALKSAGLYINGDDVEEGDPIDLLSEALPNLEKQSISSPAIGPFSKVVVCGFLM